MRFLFLLLTACSSGKNPDVPKPQHRKPSSTAKVYYAKNDWNIRSEKDIPSIGKLSKKNDVLIWDLQGSILDGSKQTGDGSQAEKQEPLFRARVSLIVKNGFVRNNKNAATFYAKNSGIERITFTDIGEDAVATSKGAVSFSIKDSEFINDRDGDKSIQLNDAKDALVEGNLVYSGRTCMRIGQRDANTPKHTATVKNNRFYGCETAINASSITAIESSNKYDNVPTKHVLDSGAIIK